MGIDGSKCSLQHKLKKMKSLNRVSQEFSEENTMDINEHTDGTNSIVQEISNDNASKTLNSCNNSSNKILKPEECYPAYRCDKLSSVFVDVGSDFVESDYLFEEDVSICKVNSEILFADHKGIDYNLVKSVKIEQNDEVSSKENGISVQNFAAAANVSGICTSDDKLGLCSNGNVENMYENSNDCDKKPNICLDYSRISNILNASGCFEKIKTNVKEEGVEDELVHHSTKNIFPKLKEEIFSDEEVSIINESIIDIDLHPVNKIEELPDIDENNILGVDRSCSGYSSTFGKEYVEKLCVADEDMKVNSKNDDMCQNQRNGKFKHSTDRHYFCEVCSKGFVDLHNLNIHKHIHTGDKSFNCDMCGIVFAQLASLEKHKLKHTVDRPYGCDICGKAFARHTHLTYHKRIHTGERPYGCDMCGKAFTQQDTLTKHKRIHTGDRPFGCSVCGKTFLRASSLRSHDIIHTGNRPFGCSVCCKAFSHVSSLIRHKRIHTGERPYSCDVCGKAFKHLSYLKDHNRIHTGDKSFGCNVCGKAFTQVSTLKNHKHIHAGDKSYSCDICGKAFTQESILKNHKHIHTGEMPYGCDICGKAFKHLCHLKDHNRIHTGERPYGCDICGKSYTQLAHLKGHNRIHTGDKSICCSVCGRTFSRASSLIRHKRIHIG